MRFSESILVGATVVTSKPGQLNHCALGMAAIGHGYGFGPPAAVAHGNDSRTANVGDVWPFLNTIQPRPCSCWFPLGKMRAKNVIAHLFDKHIYGKRDWTLDRLSAWVATIEPRDSQESVATSSGVNSEKETPCTA